MKKCVKCNIEKNINEFGKKKLTKFNQGLKGYCKKCEQIGVEKNQKNIKDNDPIKYKINQNRIVESNKKLNIRNLSFIYRYLKIFGVCIDCGVKDIRILEFDHVRGEKIDGVITLASNLSSILKIKEEIRKCEIRCCNCHRIKTQTQLGWRIKWKYNWL
jgi:hypothetical protein